MTEKPKFEHTAVVGHHYLSQAQYSQLMETGRLVLESGEVLEMSEDRRNREAAFSNSIIEMFVPKRQ